MRDKCPIHGELAVEFGGVFREGIDCRLCYLSAYGLLSIGNVAASPDLDYSGKNRPIRSPACLSLQMANVIDRRNLSCVHKWIVGCDVHGRCTTGEKVDGVECCRTCNEYQNPDADDEPAMKFDRVVLINLKRRPDRLEEFRARQILQGWKLPEPEIFEAIDGNRVGVPGYYQAGGGAFGCMRSHVAILERAVMDGVESLLVLEDDLTWMSDSWDTLGDFFKNVPSDWEQLMLGGQHIQDPMSMPGGIVKCRNCQRTHAYAIRGQAIKDLLNLWYTCNTHIDHRMGPWQGSRKVYAPAKFVFGQSAGQSDISGSRNPDKYWVAPAADQPVVFLKTHRGVMNVLRGRGFHAGHSREPLTGLDIGLEVAARATGEVRIGLLRKWLDTVLWEAASMENSVATLWHPDFTVDDLRTVFAGPIVVVSGNTVEECLTSLPDTVKVKPNYALSHVVYLNADRRVAESIKPLGFHIGNWRCNDSGHDHGLRKIAILPGKVEPLRDWLSAVASESLEMGWVPTVWHPGISADDVKAAAGNRKVIEISATSAKEVVEQFRSQL